MGKHEDLTQNYSTWGDKLLQHTDVLHSIQRGKWIKPITVQLSPCEPCESDCAFCSVAERPLKSVMPWWKIFNTLTSFKHLGAKSVEITGGGNPLLWKDGDRDINDIIELADGLGFDIGIITNSHILSRIKPANYQRISWIRISLIKLDEGKDPEDYYFCGFPQERLAFSYIIYDRCDSTPRLEQMRLGTTIDTIKRLAKMVELYPDVKFVRIAGDCLVKGNNLDVREKWRSIIDEVDKLGKFFVKDIGSNDDAYPHGCYVGMVRPYVAPSPDGDGEYYVYICTSHVLNKRTYDKRFALCNVNDITSTWHKMNERFYVDGYPYEVDGNGGCRWDETCRFCYYFNNNQLLHTVATELPDKNFA